jgi:hypothetical protein
MKYRLWGKLEFVLWLSVLTTSPLGAGDSRRFLNRSIYVPVEFKLCEHLTQGILYIGDLAVAMMPTERVFQFTYYPDLHRLEPEATEVRIEGVDLAGTPFTARLAISPRGIFSSKERIDLDMENQLKKFSYKIDIRYQRTSLVVRCDGSCTKQKAGGGAKNPAGGIVDDDVTPQPR